MLDAMRHGWAQHYATGDASFMDHNSRNEYLLALVASASRCKGEAEDKGTDNIRSCAEFLASMKAEDGQKVAHPSSVGLPPIWSAIQDQRHKLSALQHARPQMQGMQRPKPMRPWEWDMASTPTSSTPTSSAVEPPTSHFKIGPEPLEDPSSAAVVAIGHAHFLPGSHEEPGRPPLVFMPEPQLQFTNTCHNHYFKSQSSSLMEQDISKGTDKAKDQRVTIYNTRERRKLSGNAAPFRRNLEAYLALHPDWELYTGQDGGGSRKKRKLDTGGKLAAVTSPEQSPKSVEAVKVLKQDAKKDSLDTLKLEAAHRAPPVKSVPYVLSQKADLKQPPQKPSPQKPREDLKQPLQKRSPQKPQEKRPPGGIKEDCEAWVKPAMRIKEEVEASNPMSSLLWAIGHGRQEAQVSSS